MQKRPLAVALALVCALVTTSAHARTQKNSHHTHKHVLIALADSAGCIFDNNGRTVCQGPIQRASESPMGRRHIAPSNGYDMAQIVGHPPGCPGRAFCGCGVSVKVFGYPVRDLFLAANWRKFPSAYPSAGMVAWRNHHVMYIMQANGDGTATVYDPNSGGHQTRIHTRSLAGYRVVDPHGSRMAMR